VGSSCRSFNLLRKEFLSAPIHSPLSGRLIGPSRPFAPVLHLQQHELGRSLQLRNEPRVSPTPVVNNPSLRSGHPSTTGTLLVLKTVEAGTAAAGGGAVDGVFWYTKYVHYTLVWICLWN
jgi:hypothetical protein